ncbi:MAG: hypothetical protein EZS28_042301 [Streblomastix strix]|uniref:Uncharacterized protein n=1 Tax=Streblomastix strix TaxID=222440 RepID=A0A5J4TW93_9EUKA|nr:MAG: hypothetical protein EZS28_042301 [Streblomastix strix]
MRISEYIMALACFNKSSDLFAASTPDRSIKVWDTITGKLRRTLRIANAARDWTCLKWIDSQSEGNV